MSDREFYETALNEAKHNYAKWQEAYQLSNNVYSCPEARKMCEALELEMSELKDKLKQGDKS